MFGRERLAGDAQLYREGAVHERGEERGHHIRGSQQWYIFTGAQR